MSINGLEPIIPPTYTMKQVTQITDSIFPSLDSIAVFKVVENSNVYYFMMISSIQIKLTTLIPSEVRRL